MSVVYMPHPVIGFERKSIPQLLTGSGVIQEKFASNALVLVNPPVMPLVYLGQIDDLRDKHLATKTNKAAVPAREAAADLVWASTKGLCGFTLQLCYASPEKASTIIAASGFKESLSSTHQKQILALSLTTNAGEIRCHANASKLVGAGNRRSGRRDYHWRHAIIPPPAAGDAPAVPTVWITDEATPVAHTLITGIPPLTLVAVEVAVKDSVGLGDWSQAVTILVTR